jgi:hypothetical protein
MMSDETAKEIAEREIGRTDDRKDTAERKGGRSGQSGRGKEVKPPKNPTTEPRHPGHASSAAAADQRRFERTYTRM